MYSQTLTPLLEPSKAYGYAGWQLNSDNPNDSTYYQIEIIDADYDTAGKPILENATLISSFSSSKNYVRLSRPLTNDPRIFVHITAYALANDYLDDIILPACDGCKYETEAEWVCNGTTYAYSIKKIVHKSNNNTYLRVESAGEWDPINNVEIPYYLYMLQSTFNANNYNSKAVGRDVIVFNATHSNSVRNASGAHLNGLVVGVEKNKTKWESPNWNYNNDFSCFPITINTIHTSIYSTDPLSKAINISNNNVTNLDTNCNSLKCTPYPGKAIGNGSIPNGKPIGYDDSLRVTWYDYVTLDTTPKDITPVDTSNPWKNSPVHNLQSFNQLIDLIASTDSNYNDNSIKNFPISHFENIYLKKVGDTSLTNFYDYDISEIFEDGTISYPDLTLSNGLYRASLMFADTTMTFVYFEFQNQTENESLLLSEKVTSTISPNPTNLTSVNISFDLQEYSNELNPIITVFDFNNNLYHDGQVFNVQNETVSINYSSTPSSGQLLFVKIVFDDQSYVVHSIIAQ